jgi:hypothetical protein
MTKKIDKASHLPKKNGTHYHSVGCGTPNWMTLSIMRSFSAAHVMPWFAFTMTQAT